MWTYAINTGFLYSQSGEMVGAGHAGHDVIENGVIAVQGKNNPAMTQMKDIGPLPVGLYTIMPPKNYGTVGQYAMALVPDPTNEMFGRSGFFMHGDSRENQGLDSDGCIVQQFPVRQLVAKSNDTRLEVVREVGFAQTEQESQ